MTHGGPDAEVRHVGDLGNVHADSTGSSRSFIILKGTVKLNSRFIFIYMNLWIGIFLDSPCPQNLEFQPRNSKKLKKK